MTRMTAPGTPSRSGWTGQLWTGIEPTYRAILEHPFITGLTSGELAVDSFVHFIAQDTYYLRGFSRALLALAAKAPSPEMTQVLTAHAVAAVHAETGLHAELMAALGRDPAELDEISASATSCGYTSFIVATAFAADFSDGLAAVLPCFWIYAEVGKHLTMTGSPNLVYRKWIDSYGGEDYLHEVELALDLTDVIGAQLGPSAESRARDLFQTAARFEWMFWDAAYRMEGWPV